MPVIDLEELPAGGALAGSVEDFGCALRSLAVLLVLSVVTDLSPAGFVELVLLVSGNLSAELLLLTGVDVLDVGATGVAGLLDALVPDATLGAAGIGEARATWISPAHGHHSLNPYQ